MKQYLITFTYTRFYFFRVYGRTFLSSFDVDLKQNLIALEKSLEKETWKTVGIIWFYKI